MLSNIAPTRRYFFTMFMVSCALMTVFTAVVYRQSRINSNRNAWVVHSYEVLRHMHLIEADVLSLETAQRGYMLSGAAKYLEPYTQANHSVEQELILLAKLTIDNPREQERIKRMHDTITGYRAVIALHLNRFIQTGARELSRADLDQSRNAMEAVRANLDLLVQEEQSLLEARLYAAQEQQHSYVLTLFAGAGLGLTALAIANVIIYALLSRSKRIEDALNASEERFKLVMTGLNDGIFDLAPPDTIYYSPSLKAMVGYADEELPNEVQAFNELIHPDDRDDAWKIYHQFKAREIPEYNNIFRVKHRDGSWRWHMSRGVGLWNDQNELIRLIGSHTDVTAQKEREEELMALNADLEGFTYIASHDLRAPLVNLKGFSGEIQHALDEASPILARILPTLSEADQSTLKATLEKDVPESISFINSAVERMDKLTTAILHMSRIGRKEYTIEEVDPNVVVRQCLKTLAHEIGQNHVTVECSQLPLVHTDALALEQMFGNLLDNAVKYLAPDRPGKITINGQRFLTEILFSVADNGRGISETDSSKIFEVFRRASNSSDVRGTGMGMAYVKATLRKLGGRIWYKSELGKGTTFYFVLPAQAKKGAV